MDANVAVPSENNLVAKAQAQPTANNTPKRGGKY